MVRIAAIGDTNVDCYLSSGLMYPGGNCLNVSMYARRFGVASAFIGAVGNDHAGEFTRVSLVSAGVDTMQLRTVDGSTAFCLIDHIDGDRVFRASDLGVSRFRPTPEDINYLTSFDSAHVGQTSGLDEFVPSIARKTNLSYDFSTKCDRSHYRQIAGNCLLATFSVADLPSAQQQELQKDVLDAGAKWILMTRGQDGAVLANRETEYCVSAVSTSVVDTLGAGDTFITRTLIGLLRNEAPDELLRCAAKAAAETCGYLGPHGLGTDIKLNQDINTLL